MVRYSEIGLKSTPVRTRYEDQLRDSMLSMLAADGVEALIDKGDARFYVRTSDYEKTIKSLKKVFGVGSLSVAMVTNSTMEDICKTAALYSEGRLSEGESFAVKPRREGTHSYRSTDVGREAGAAIYRANEHLNVKVNLTDPDKVFFIEVRENKAYIFDEYIRGHGGLPVGTQGRVIVSVNNDRDVLSAWLMMKRGCRIIVKGKDESGTLVHYDPDIRFIEEGEEEPRALGYVLGTSLKDLKNVNVADYDLPVYFPTIGMSDSKVKEMVDVLKNEVK